MFFVIITLKGYGGGEFCLSIESEWKRAQPIVDGCLPHTHDGIIVIRLGNSKG